jgi:hypothetical protein
MWSAVVVGTHPIETEQEVWLELQAGDEFSGTMPGFWLQNRENNSLWHVPIPPQPVGTRLHYRACARRGQEMAHSAYQDVEVRPNLPVRTEAARTPGGIPEGLVGNRHMTVKVDGRGATYDVFFPTVGLHADVRPAEGERPHSRSHFRTIVAGLAIGRRLDWFDERVSWDASQAYREGTNVLVTRLQWRRGAVQVEQSDFVVSDADLPLANGHVAPGQYIKRYVITNATPSKITPLFGLYVHAEVNGGVGDHVITWVDDEQTLLALNRGHRHLNRKLSREATVEFAVALADRSDATCEPAGRDEAVLFRRLEIEGGGAVTVDVLVSGAFTGWPGDDGTFHYWLRPALQWFRSRDVGNLESNAVASWRELVARLPVLRFPDRKYGQQLERSALAAAVHADADTGAVAKGYQRGIHAYCWPRDALGAGGAFDRIGWNQIGRRVFDWLSKVRGYYRQYTYFFQKYTIDGIPEWETPAIDQTALIPWALERHYRRTGDLEFVASQWAMVEQAAEVCLGKGGHPGLAWLEDLSLVRSAGLWDTRYAAFCYSNACIVAGLRSAIRLARRVNRQDSVEGWSKAAERILNVGILSDLRAGSTGPGLYDTVLGRFLDARRISRERGVWSGDPSRVIERSDALDISQLALAVPLEILPAGDGRILRTAEAILARNTMGSNVPLIAPWTGTSGVSMSPGEVIEQDAASLATLWMARYLIQLGKETGDGRYWVRAINLLDDLLGHIGPLGLSLALPISGVESQDGAFPAPGVWDLHGMVIEVLMDVAGLDFDAAENRIILEPALAASWPMIGISHELLCGDVAYTLQRKAENPPRYSLVVESDLKVQTPLDLSICCPDLPQLGAWQASTESAAPHFDAARRLLRWREKLPAGEARLEWSWG